MTYIISNPNVSKVYDRVLSRTPAKKDQEKVKDMFAKAAQFDGDNELSEAEAQFVEDVLNKHDRWTRHNLGIRSYDDIEIMQASHDVTVRECLEALREIDVNEEIKAATVEYLLLAGFEPSQVVELIKYGASKAGEGAAHAIAALPTAVEALFGGGLDIGETIGILNTVIMSMGTHCGEAFEALPTAIQALKKIPLKKDEVRHLLFSIASSGEDNTGYAYSALPKIVEALIELDEPHMNFTILKYIISRSRESTNNSFETFPIAVTALTKLGWEKHEIFNLLANIAGSIKGAQFQTYSSLGRTVRSLHALGLDKTMIRQFLIGIAKSSGDPDSLRHLPHVLTALEDVGISSLQERLEYLKKIAATAGGQAGKTFRFIPTFIEGTKKLGLADQEILGLLEEIVNNAGVQAGSFLSKLLLSMEDRTSLDTRMDEFRALWALGITWIDRFSPQARAEIIENRQQNAPDDRPLAVIIYPTSDWNGAFTSDAAVIDDLIARGFRVMYYEVSTDQQMYAALQEATAEQQASLLIIGGHGSQTTTSFGAGDPAREEIDQELFALDPSDETEMIEQELSRTLINGGHVILVSCSTGQGRKIVDNNANFLSRIFPQAAGVWAPTEPTSFDQIIFDDNNNVIDVKFGKGVSPYRAISEPTH
ncbi:hypothetical protein ACFL31_01705 [Candidatus Margulisiibacteriota bacterium]